MEAARAGVIPAGGTHPHLVLVTVPDERRLELAARRLRVLNIPYAPFREPDLADSLTAVCTGPVLDRKPFRNFPLLQGV